MVYAKTTYAYKILQILQQLPFVQILTLQTYFVVWVIKMIFDSINGCTLYVNHIHLVEYCNACLLGQIWG